ncbi:MAG: Rrf2 family transcriptional regulator [Candidatus Omnitrophica bacterium]|nr:Rrf2 family transcriptional regulator [Candidatus Omnitrophota bacterium]
MLRLYSKGCEHAIQALMTISREECRRGFSARLICRRAGLPEFFTRKVFQALVKSRVLTAKRGPGGGYRFSKDPGKVSILSVVYAIDGRNAFDKCVVQDNKCDHKGRCSLHPMWMKTKASLIRQLGSRPVAGLIEEGA